MKSKAFGLALIIAVAAATVAPAWAVTLDNSPPSGSISSFGVPNTQTYGQTFTAPITGTMTSFTLWLNGGVGELFGGVGTWNGTSSYGGGFGSPTNLYQSANVASAGAGPYTFTPNINVVAGVNYVAFLSVFGVAGANATTSMPLSSSPVDGINYFVWNNTSDPRNNPSWNYFANFGNVQFSASFEAASAVPIPAAFPLFASALGLGGLLGYRRKRQAGLVTA